VYAVGLTSRERTAVLAVRSCVSTVRRSSPFLSGRSNAEFERFEADGTP